MTTLKPVGWEECTLSDILSLKNGFAFKSSEYKGAGIPILRISDIQEGSVSPSNAKYIDEHENFDEYVVSKGDILIAMSGATTGKFGIYDSAIKAYQNQRVGRFSLYSTELISNSFVYYLLFSLKREIEKSAYGGAQPNISSSKIESLNFLLPPTGEQARIVNKIEELLSELDKGVESFKTAKAQLAVYRQSLLKHAFEGKLTEQWRKDNTDKLESPEKLLARIQQEREVRYQQHLDDWKQEIKQWEADGKEGKKPTKPKKLKVIPSDEIYIKASVKLPFGWEYCSLGKLIDEPKYGTSKKCTYDEEGEGVLRIPNVANNIIDSSDLKYAKFEEHEIKDYQLNEGDIVIIRSNGTVSLVGKGALINSQDTKFLYAGYLIRLRASAQVLYPKYLLYALQSYPLRKQIEEKAKSTSGVNNINSGELQSLVISIPSLDEQKQVVLEIESKISLCESAICDIEDNLKKSELLRQSILKKAFSGQLVPQNSDDEAASELLKKIAIEKAELAEKEKAENAAARKSKSKVKATAKKAKA